MAYTGNSIVDYLKSTGQASDYNTRANLAKTSGINNYSGTAEQNTQLLGILNKPAPTNSNPTTTQNNAPVNNTNAPITPTTPIPVPSYGSPVIVNGQEVGKAAFNPNTGQPLNPQDEIAKINSDANNNQNSSLSTIQNSLGTSKVDVSDSSKIAKAITDSFLSTNNSPAVPSLEQKQAELRASAAVDPLEKNMAGVDASIAKLKSDYATLTDTETNRQVSTIQINRRKNQEQIQYEDQLRRLTDERNSIANELNQKYSVIDSTMKYAQQDYQNATQSYETKFNQAINMYNLISGVEETAKSDAERLADRSKANLQIITESLKGHDYTTLDPVTKANITKLELESGLPAGIGQYILEQVNEPVVSMGSEFTDANGKRQLPVYTKDPKTGLLTSKLITIGTARVESSTTESTTKSMKAAVQEDVIAVINYMRQNDQRGIDPDQYNNYKNQLLEQYGTSAVAELDKAIKKAGFQVDDGNFKVGGREA